MKLKNYLNLLIVFVICTLSPHNLSSQNHENNSFMYVVNGKLIDESEASELFKNDQVKTMRKGVSESEKEQLVKKYGKEKNLCCYPFLEEKKEKQY